MCPTLRRRVVRAIAAQFTPTELLTVMQRLTARPLTRPEFRLYQLVGAAWARDYD